MAPRHRAGDRGPMYFYSPQPLPLQVMVGAASTLRREWDHSRPPNIDKAPVTPQESVSLPPLLPTLAQGPLGALRVCQAATESPVELINVHLFIH